MSYFNAIHCSINKLVVMIEMFLLAFPYDQQTFK